jgi:hypothetical protein
VTDERRPSNVALSVSAAAGLVPLFLATVLNALRPDLLAPMLDHAFGRVAVALLVLFAAVGTLCFVAACFARETSARVILRVVAVVVGVLPGCALALFAPIVFAFMYGSV